MIHIDLEGFMKYLVLLMAISINSFAAPADDNININQVFVTSDGSFAVKGAVIIPKANALRVCGGGQNWAKYWAGVGPNSDDRIVSVILSAHAQKKSISIRTDGCHGDWHKITSVYVN